MQAASAISAPTTAPATIADVELQAVSAALARLQESHARRRGARHPPHDPAPGRWRTRK
jgi:hypothetical protein